MNEGPSRPSYLSSTEHRAPAIAQFRGKVNEGGRPFGSHNLGF